jgi:UDP-glucose 4-epimerase
MKYKKALVTGGAGFIGSHIALRLTQMGIETVVMDNLSVGRREFVPKKAKLIKGDILDYGLLKKASRGVDIIFHEAARVSIRNSFENFYDDANVNVLGTVNVLRAMKDNHVKKIVYASSMAVYGRNKLPISETGVLEPISPYGIGKLASEKYCLLMAKADNFDAVLLRYFNTYGPRQTFTPYVGVVTIFINQLLRNKAPVIFGSGGQKRDFIHVEDIAEANILAMGKDIKSGIFNVGTSVGTTVNEIARLLISEINPGIKPKYAPQPIGEPADSVASINKAIQALGFKPRFRLENRIGEVIDWIKNESSAGISL